MFLFVLKKMLKNRWMTICLLVGFILVVAMVSSIPVYTNGILQKMLTGDMEDYQTEKNMFPGYYSIKANFTFFNDSERISAYRALKENINEKLVPDIGLPLLSMSEEVFLDFYNTVPADPREQKPQERIVTVRSRTDIENHIQITHGRMYSDKPDNGTIEVIVTEKFLEINSFILGDELVFGKDSDAPFSRIRITGIFERSDLRDTYWAYEPDSTEMFASYEYFQNEILDKNITLIRSVDWLAAFDYHSITLSGLGVLQSAMENYKKLARAHSGYLDIRFEAEDILEKYEVREKQLRLTLWIIEVPVLILLFFYIFMISNLIIKSETNEISILKSRGKSTGQVFLVYFFESMILGLLSLVIGPALGFLICRLMGASNGFLEFVRRSPLPLTFSSQVIVYSLISLLFLVITMMVPTYFSSRMSIVQAKQQKGRELKFPVWKRFFIDFLLLLVSGYGYYRYSSQQQLLQTTAAEGYSIGIDPLLFLTSAMFILGAGLFFLRVFPALVKGIYLIGKKIWPPEIYCAILQVARTGRNGQFLMLFLVFSIAIGIFDANMARTLNRNAEDKIRYENGADIVLLPVWEEMDRQLGTAGSAPYADQSDVPELSAVPHFREPPYIPYTQLAGVEKTTKVFTTDAGKVYLGDRTIRNVQIQGIIPHEFGSITWFRDDLLAGHINEYLNLLAESSSAVFISRNFQTEYNVAPGDYISFTWGDQEYVQAVIYGFIDFWPGYNPYKGSDSNEGNYFIVSNLYYLQNKLSKDPYRIWIDKAGNTGDEIIYNDIRQKGLQIEELHSSDQEIIRQKNDPMLKGINGALTQGFILIMLVCTIGFLIYWIISLQGRVLQFGILRAMGLSQGKVVLIIIMEQLIMSGAAILTGIIIGGTASRLFVPFLQLVFSSAEQVPPFRVIALQSDYNKIYMIVALMLFTGIVIFMVFMRRLKIGSALKLGED